MDSYLKICSKLLMLLGLVAVILASNFGGITAYTTPDFLLPRHIPTRTLSGIEVGRYLIEGENNSETGKPVDNTVRIDPLDGFKKYREGYNISNKHYWSSTAFTGRYGYAIAVLWLLAGVLYAGFLLASKFCLNSKRKAKRSNCTERWHSGTILAALLLTFLAIIASGVVFGGNARFYSRATTVKNIIIDATEEASDAIYGVTGAIRTLQENAMQENLDLVDDTGRLNSTVRQLNQGADNIRRQARKNKRWVDLGLKIMYAATTVVAALNLIAILALLVLGILQRHKPLCLLLIFCWFFTFLCWIYFGAYFFIERFAGDTCTALVEYKQDPRDSSLGSILPCDDLISAESLLLNARGEIYDFIEQINNNISAPPASLILNQARICNPLSGPPEYFYQPENCGNNTIRLGDIPQLLVRFACTGGNNGTCEAGQFIPTSTYNTIVAYASSIQELLDAIPGMENLVDCQIVHDAIDQILSQQCEPVKKFIRMVWGAMIVLSTLMVALILTWTAAVHHNRKNRFSDGSVKPHSSPNRKAGDETQMNSENV